MEKFIHLHTHTAYSLLDGSCSMEGLLQRGADLNMPAMAITDHGVMYGVLDFYKTAQTMGLKPIIGCEVYVAPRGRFSKEGRMDEGGYHLVLLAKNIEGYHNLIQLVSKGFTEGFYYKPRVDKQLLAQHAQGLIALSACLAGEIPVKIKSGNTQASQALGEYLDIFGPDHLYLEIQDNGVDQQGEINERLIRLGKQTKVPLVATNDVHYLTRADARVHDVLLCMQTGKRISEPNRLKFPTAEFYLKSAEEMGRLFAHCPQALANTWEIAQRCHVQIPMGKLHLPSYPIPGDMSVDTYLNHLVTTGATKRFGRVNEQVRNRLDHELSIINSMDYGGYFLIVADFIDFARSRQILVGPGRGSAASSLVAYCLGITQINPLQYGLIFERFLNPQRSGLPDIDTDFADDRRGEIIDYVVGKYGQQQVAQIITFGTMAARGAIRDVGRVMEMPYAQVDTIAKLVPNEPGITLDNVPQIASLAQKDIKTGELIHIAKALEGLPRHISVHAAGVVIGDQPLVNHIPVQLGNEEQLLTQYPMEYLEDIGLLKMDFLGLRTLTVIAKAAELIKQTHDIELELSELPLDDPLVFKTLSKGESSGVFQMESRLFRSLLQEIKPNCFEDLIAILALGRPGPMARVDDFVKRKNGMEETQYAHPRLAPILSTTYGVMIYQEQVMAIATSLAGYTPAQADLLRRAMGKKSRDIMEGERVRFIQGALDNGISQTVGEKIFAQIETFAGYGFNKSHSAAYALISYGTAYLKTHYPLEFMAALLSSIMHSVDKVAGYINNCRQQGIKILPPDINTSGVDFVVRDGVIRFGLAAIKNVGINAIEGILQARSTGPFSSIYDLCQRVSQRFVNRKLLESLIKAGALDNLHPNRAEHLAMIDLALGNQGTHGQLSLLDCQPEIPKVPSFSNQEMLAMEKEALGLYISGHPLAHMKELIRELKPDTWEKILHRQDGTRVLCMGLLSSGKKIKTKKGAEMYFGQLDDGTGQGELVFLPPVYAKFKENLDVDSLLLIAGRVESADEGHKILVDNVLSLREQPVIIHVPWELEGQLPKLQAVLGANKGTQPVILIIGGQVLVITQEDYWVCGGTELNKNISSLGFLVV